MRFTVVSALRELADGRDRSALYRAWGICLHSGIPDRAALAHVGSFHSRPTEMLRKYLLAGLEQGRAITSLVRERPTLLEPIEGAVLAAGDEAGTLETSLPMLAEHFGDEYKRMVKLRSRLAYPAFLVLAGGAVLALPIMLRGRTVAYLGVIVAEVAALLLLGGIPIAILMRVRASRASITRARFARTLAMAVEAGLPADRAVRLAVEASGNPALIRYIANQSVQQIGDVPLGDLFSRCRAVPAELLTEMRVAEATGDYSTTLRRYADRIEGRPAIVAER